MILVTDSSPARTARPPRRSGPRPSPPGASPRGAGPEQNDLLGIDLGHNGPDHPVEESVGNGNHAVLFQVVRPCGWESLETATNIGVRWGDFKPENTRRPSGTSGHVPWFSHRQLSRLCQSEIPLRFALPPLTKGGLRGIFPAQVPERTSQPAFPAKPDCTGAGLCRYFCRRVC